MEQLVAVCAVVVRGERVLAMRRAAHKVGAGLWETLSGRVEPGEDPHDAVVREIAEETGLRCDVEKRPVTAYAARRGDAPMIVIVYRAASVSGEVQRSDEHDDHAWMTADEFASRSSLVQLVDVVRGVLASHTLR